MATQAPPAGRCLRRGLAVLGELNRRHFAGAAEIGAAIGVPRPTVHRLLLTLVADGYARQVAATEYFTPYARVTELSAGWDVRARALALAAQRIDDLAGQTGWPIDLSVFDRDAMVVRHSTYERAAWSLLPQSPVGHRIPLLGTAPGRVYLAGLEPHQREPFLDRADASECQAIDLAARRGFAFRDGGVLPRTTSVAVPIRGGGGTLLCVSMAFIRSATILSDAIDAHVPMLTAVATDVEAQLD